MPSPETSLAVFNKGGGQRFSPMLTVGKLAAKPKENMARAKSAGARGRPADSPKKNKNMVFSPLASTDGKEPVAKAFYEWMANDQALWVDLKKFARKVGESVATGSSPGCERDEEPELSATAPATVEQLSPAEVPEAMPSTTKLAASAPPTLIVAASAEPPTPKVATPAAPSSAKLEVPPSALSKTASRSTLKSDSSSASLGRSGSQRSVVIGDATQYKFLQGSKIKPRESTRTSSPGALLSASKKAAAAAAPAAEPAAAPAAAPTAAPVAAPAASAASPIDSTECNAVRLLRTEGISLGLDVVPNFKAATLIVKKVKSGLVEDWNRSNPGSKVNPGDEIFEVNGFQGDARALASQCVNSGKQLDMKLYRKGKEALPTKSRQAPSEGSSERKGQIAKGLAEAAAVTTASNPLVAAGLKAAAAALEKELLSSDGRKRLIANSLSEAAIVTTASSPLVAAGLKAAAAAVQKELSEEPLPRPEDSDLKGRPNRAQSEDKVDIETWIATSAESTTASLASMSTPLASTTTSASSVSQAASSEVSKAEKVTRVRKKAAARLLTGLANGKLQEAVNEVAKVKKVAGVEKKALSTQALGSNDMPAIFIVVYSTPVAGQAPVSKPLQPPQAKKDCLEREKKREAARQKARAHLFAAANNGLLKEAVNETRKSGSSASASVRQVIVTRQLADAKDLGYICHNRMPTGDLTPTWSLWECKDETAAKSFQTFIDGPNGIGEGCFANNCYRIAPAGTFQVMPSGMLPQSKFVAADPLGKVMSSTGCFFWVSHCFRSDKVISTTSWWENMNMISTSPADVQRLDDRHHQLGLHNHNLLAAGVDGPIFCIWESQADMSKADFQKFVDGPDGLGPGVFVNEVHKVAAGATLPSAYFKVDASTTQALDELRRKASAVISTAAEDGRLTEEMSKLQKQADKRNYQDAKPTDSSEKSAAKKALKCGQRVLLAGQRGVIRFLGPTLFAKGVWVGVELDRPLGKNNGSVNNVDYFSCEPKRGIFVREEVVALENSGQEAAVKTNGDTAEDLEACCNCARIGVKLFQDSNDKRFYCERCWPDYKESPTLQSPNLPSSPNREQPVAAEILPLVTVVAKDTWSDQDLAQAWLAMPIDEWPQEDATEIPGGTEKLPRSKAEDWSNVSICVRRDVVGTHSRERFTDQTPSEGDFLRSRYKCMSVLGQGYFTTAYLAEDTRQLDSRNCMVCIKKYQRLSIEALADLMAIGKRVEDVDPESMYFPRFLDAFHDVVTFTVETLVDGTDCLARAKADPKFFSDLSKLRVVARDCLRGLVLLAQAGIVHNDMKPDNFMWVPGQDEKGSSVKIVDLGCARLDREKEPGRNWALNESGAGHVGKWSPEMVLRLPITAVADVWGLSVSLCELHTGRAMWRDDRDTCETVLAQAIGLCGLADGLPPELLQRSPMDIRTMFSPSPRHFPVRRNALGLIEALEPAEVGLDQVVGNYSSDTGKRDFRDLLSVTFMADPLYRPPAAEVLQTCRFVQEP